MTGLSRCGKYRRLLRDDLRSFLFVLSDRLLARENRRVRELGHRLGELGWRLR